LSKLVRLVGKLNRLAGTVNRLFEVVAEPGAQMPFSRSSPLSLPVQLIAFIDGTFPQPPEAGKSFRDTHTSRNSCKLPIKSGKRYPI
jgi:hypothetical protein